jgi:hypothetical protein
MLGFAQVSSVDRMTSTPVHLIHTHLPCFDQVHRVVSLRDLDHVCMKVHACAAPSSLGNQQRLNQHPMKRHLRSRNAFAGKLDAQNSRAAGLLLSVLNVRTCI